jgi:hypothetical protein
MSKSYPAKRQFLNMLKQPDPGYCQFLLDEIQSGASRLYGASKSKIVLVPAKPILNFTAQVLDFKAGAGPTFMLNVDNFPGANGAVAHNNLHLPPFPISRRSQLAR